ncbi:MAG TPA: hypothetical protein VKY74_14655 [Chloroflexia bacterium]|nr:hypothetical protein [Chloroflexia bacterium]
MVADEVRWYQREIRELLQHLYPAQEVKDEWRADFDGWMYTPRLDVAVGPYAINCQYIDEYDFLMERSRRFVNALIYYHILNSYQIDLLDLTPDSSIIEIIYQRLLATNPNARCFLAIEIEKTTSTKHVLGGILNASALGRIAIIVAWYDNLPLSVDMPLQVAARQYRRADSSTRVDIPLLVSLGRYFGFLRHVEKNTLDTGNVLFLHRAQLREVLRTALAFE